MIRAPLVVVVVALVAASAAAGAPSSTIRPAPGTPDPRGTVLTSADLGRANVVAQRYFKDPDFPSPISYVRTFENGSLGGTSLSFVESQADVGKSAPKTAVFLAGLKSYFASEEARRLIAKSFVDEIGSEALIT